MDATPSLSPSASRTPAKPSKAPASPSAAPASSNPASGPPTNGKGGGPISVTGSSGVALTFDDGPHPTWTPKILDLLKQQGVKATFCVVGVNVRSYPQLVQRIAREGHTLCNHSWSHDLNLGTKSTAEIRTDMQRTNDAIRAAVPGVKIEYFRHPGGKFTAASNTVARELGMTPLGWAVDPRDWAKPGSAAIVNYVEQHTRAGSIVLSHDGGGDRTQTYDAYRTLLPWLKARFQLVAL